MQKRMMLEACYQCRISPKSKVPTTAYGSMALSFSSFAQVGRRLVKSVHTKPTIAPETHQSEKPRTLNPLDRSVSPCQLDATAHFCWERHSFARMTKHIHVLGVLRQGHRHSKMASRPFRYSAARGAADSRQALQRNDYRTILL